LGGVQEAVPVRAADVRQGDSVRDSAGWYLDVSCKRTYRRPQGDYVVLTVQAPGLGRSVTRRYGPDDMVLVRRVQEMDPAQMQAQAQQYQQQRDPTFRGREARRRRGHVDISMPDILARETQQFVGAVVQALQIGVITPEQGAKLVITALGLPVDEGLREWRTMLEDHAAQAQMQQQQQLALQQQALQQQAQAGQQGNPFQNQVPSVPTPNLEPSSGQQGGGVSGSARVPSGGMSRTPQ
jgi:hypothetical protein